MKPAIKALFRQLKESGSRMSDDKVPMMGAALAYYMMFSIAPLLVIAIGAAGVVFGTSASADIFAAMKDVIGAQGANAVQSMVNAVAARPHAGVVATAVGVVTMLVGASGVFAQLQQSLNIIWKVAAKPGATWRVLFRQRLLSFGMVAVIGFLLLVSLVVSAALAAAGGWAGGNLPGMRLLWSAVDFAASFAIISGLFAAVLKLLPDVRLTWKDVRAGGAFTAFLFVIGKAAIGVYIGRSAVASSYGAAGSLIVVLLWVFFSSQILFFGAEFTRVLYLRRGGKIEPRAGATEVAIPLTATAEPVVQPATALAAGESIRQARESWLWLGGAAAAAGALLIFRSHRRGHMVVGSFACGLAAGMLALLEFPDLLAEELERKPQTPSVVSRPIAKMPMKVKIAAGVV